jgi:predicted transposase YdaD
MMAAWAGSADLRDPAVQVRTLRLLAGLDPETLATYTRIVLIAAPVESSRRALEALMATVFKNEFLDKLEAEAKARGEAMGKAAGRAEGLAQMILQVLAARGVTVPAETRDQVLACTDVAQLDARGDKAATAHSVEEVFGEGNDTL